MAAGCSAAFFAVVALSSALPIRAAEPRPNLLFIAVDDLRNELGCYGVEGIKTPNMDRLAKDGMLFTRCLVPNSICGPSRATQAL